MGARDGEGQPSIHDMPAPENYQPLLPGQVQNNHIRVTLDFVPVGERLPKTHTTVFVFSDEGDISKAEWEGDMWWLFESDTYLFPSNITHWAEITQLSKTD